MRPDQRVVRRQTRPQISCPSMEIEVCTLSYGVVYALGLRRCFPIPDLLVDDAMNDGVPSQRIGVLTTGGGDNPKGRDQRYEGYVEGIDSAWCLYGWVRKVGSPIPVRVQLMGESGILFSTTANRSRLDVAAAGLGDGNCGFLLTLPAHLFDGSVHKLGVNIVDDDGVREFRSFFGVMLPRLRASARRSAEPARSIFDRVAGDLVAEARLGDRLITDLATVLEELGNRLGNSSALGLLYAHVLRRPIDPDGLATRLTRLHANPKEYRQIVSEVVHSFEARNIHEHTAFSTIHPLGHLSAWLNAATNVIPLTIE